MEPLIIIIVAVVILFVYVAYKYNELMKESKELAEKNQYIESGTGRIREWPVGSYFNSTNCTRLLLHLIKRMILIPLYILKKK